MNEEINFSPYANVVTYTESSGRYLAEKIENKYGKAYKLIK